MYNSSTALYDGNIESYYIYNNVQSDQVEQNSNDFTPTLATYKNEVAYSGQNHIEPQAQQQQPSLAWSENANFNTNDHQQYSEVRDTSTGKEHSSYMNHHYYPIHSEAGSPECCPSSLNQQEQR